MYPPSSLWYPPLIGSDDSTLISFGKTLIEENNLTSLSQADCHKDNDVNFSCIQELIWVCREVLFSEYSEAFK